MATFRTVFRSDIDHLKAHYLRLDPRDRTLRFFGRVSDGFIKSHCEEIDWPQACIVGCFVEGVLRGAVELYLDRAYFATHGEVCISVETAWRREGIGTELLRRVLGVARNRRLHTLSLACLLDNGPMQRIARKFSDELRLYDGEICADIAVSYPSFLSLHEEACANRLGLIAIWDRAFGSAQPPSSHRVMDRKPS